jgi:integrase
VDYQAGKVSVRTGRQLSKTYLGHLRGIGRDLAAFEQAAPYPLEFARINAEFYAAFQRYYLTTLGHEVNTFGSAIKKIKSFLYWCEDHDLPVSPKFHRFEAPDQYKGADFLTEAELQAWAALQVRTPEALAYLAGHFMPPPPRPNRRPGGRAVLTFEQHLERLEQARDKFLLCAYTGLRISDADRLAPRHLHGELIRLRAGKTGVQCLIPFFDDSVFRPVALVEKYAPLGLSTCLPLVRQLDEYLPHLQQLVGITRLRVTTRVGRKTFATLKIYQGVPKTQVMLATGHKTETSFNRYLGIDEQELLAIYRRTAR